MPRYTRAGIQFSDGNIFNYYSAIPIAIGDRVVVSTRYGASIGTVVTCLNIGEDGASADPFKSGKATQRVLENTTQKIYDKENLFMTGNKTVEVKHISSNRKGIFYTDLDLVEGQLVVYDGNIPTAGDCSDKSEDFPTGLHVGVVTSTDPDVATAKQWVVDVVDLAQYMERLQRAKEAAKLKAKLDAKRKQFQDLEVLRLIAQTDPETAQMLERYTALLK